jgi:hypothetical protein
MSQFCPQKLVKIRHRIKMDQRAEIFKIKENVNVVLQMSLMKQ